ncbi:MAG: zinc ABC transporter substrate-binding protein [Microbacterium sp.]
MLKKIAIPAVLAVSAVAFVGCSSSDDAATDSSSDEKLQIVASTSVYADLASSLVGDAADVTAIVDSASADPHEYEATAQDQLAVKNADIVIDNGGGYDHYIDDMLENTDVTDVYTAVEYSDDWPGDDQADADGEVEGFNEHMWYSQATMVKLIDALATDLEKQLPDSADDITANATTLTDSLKDLEDQLGDIAAAHTGDTVFMTEPVGGYLTEAAGLTNATVDGFAEAVEEEQDVPPATLLAATDAIKNGEIDVLIANTQTGGSETTAVVDAANDAGVPVIQYSETLPDGDTYVSWMQSNIDALADALGS